MQFYTLVKKRRGFLKELLKFWREIHQSSWKLLLVVGDCFDGSFDDLVYEDPGGGKVYAT